MLELVDLSAKIPSGGVLNDINLRIKPGEIHILLGPNGSGKSSLLKTIAGISPYDQSAGEINLLGQSLEDLTIDERARLGIGLAFKLLQRSMGYRCSPSLQRSKPLMCLPMQWKN